MSVTNDGAPHIISEKVCESLDSLGLVLKDLEETMSDVRENTSVYQQAVQRMKLVQAASLEWTRHATVIRNMLKQRSAMWGGSSKGMRASPSYDSANENLEDLSSDAQKLTDSLAFIRVEKYNECRVGAEILEYGTFLLQKLHESLLHRLCRHLHGSLVLVRDIHHLRRVIEQNAAQIMQHNRPGEKNGSFSNPRTAVTMQSLTTNQHLIFRKEADFQENTKNAANIILPTIWPTSSTIRNEIVRQCSSILWEYISAPLDVSLHAHKMQYIRSVVGEEQTQLSSPMYNYYQKPQANHIHWNMKDFSNHNLERCQSMKLVLLTLGQILRDLSVVMTEVFVIPTLNQSSEIATMHLELEKKCIRQVEKPLRSLLNVLQKESNSTDQVLVGFNLLETTRMSGNLDALRRTVHTFTREAYSRYMDHIQIVRHKDAMAALVSDGVITDCTREIMNFVKITLSHFLHAFSELDSEPSESEGRLFETIQVILKRLHVIVQYALKHKAVSEDIANLFLINNYNYVYHTLCTDVELLHGFTQWDGNEELIRAYFKESLDIVIQLFLEQSWLSATAFLSNSTFIRRNPDSLWYEHPNGKSVESNDDSDRAEVKKCLASYYGAVETLLMRHHHTRIFDPNLAQYVRKLVVELVVNPLEHYLTLLEQRGIIFTNSKKHIRMNPTELRERVQHLFHVR